MLENWTMALRHPVLSMKPDGVCWTVQSNGILRWRSWYYSLARWTPTGGMKHWPSTHVNKIKVRQNGACSPVCAFRIIFPWKYLVLHTTLRHLPLGSNPISSQFHTWVALGWIWLRLGGTIILTWKGNHFLMIVISFYCCLTNFVDVFVVWHSG